MAACSGPELEGKPSQEKRLICSKSFDSSTNKDAFINRKPCSPEMSKRVTSNENTVDICSLTEEQLHSLLEEATTFNRPKEQDSSILRALRKEIVESDPCGDVNSSDALSATNASVANHGKRKNRVLGAASVQRKQMHDDSLMQSNTSWAKNERRRWGNRVERLELQSQSLQDLPSTRFSDPLDSMRAAGIGRGNRRLNKAVRANSFTLSSSSEGCEWAGIQSQVNALDASAARTSSVRRGGKPKVKCDEVNHTSPDYSLVSPLFCDTQESEVSLLSCRPLSDEAENMNYSNDSNVNGGMGIIEVESSPVEIEMLDFVGKHKCHAIDLESKSSFVYNLESNCIGGGNDCRTSLEAVDKTVIFPLKTVSSSRICASTSKGEVSCPSKIVNGLVPLERYESVKSLIPTGDDNRKGDFLFYPNVDLNGNPGSYLTSSYPFESHHLGSKVDGSALGARKTKRSKSGAISKNVSKAEDVAGYCGRLEIDKLVEYITSTDKKGGARAKTILIGPPINNRTGAPLEAKKAYVKTTKNCFKRKTGNASSGSSEEHQDGEMDMEDQADQSDGEEDYNPPEEETVPFSEGSPLPPLLDEASTFVEDFYTVTEVKESQLTEDSEFRVVVHKQRKRRQVSKKEPFRRYGGNSASSGGAIAGSGASSSSERDYYQQCHSSGMMLLSGLQLSHRTQRNKQDPNRRKSTSSMPPSEPSSADNSDLDSVHSLPVGGSVPPSTGPHPHTTPSSMSSTPQASYADIARMSGAQRITVDSSPPLESEECTKAKVPNPDLTFLSKSKSSPEPEPKRAQYNVSFPPIAEAKEVIQQRLCDVSFGFELSELLELSEGGVPVTFEFEAVPPLASAAAPPRVDHESEASSPEDNSLLVSGKRIHFKQQEQPLNFNHTQLVQFFGSAWDNVIQEYQKDGGSVNRPEGKKSYKICYYSSQVSFQ